MFKKIMFYILFGSCLILNTTSKANADFDGKELNKVFEGMHELKAMAYSGTSSKSSGSISGFFIFGFGGIGGSVESSSFPTVSFAWKDNRSGANDYIISTLPLNKIRIKINDKIQKPYVLFRWTTKSYVDKNYISSLEEAIIKNILYVVINCREEQWNPQIKIPLGN